MRPSWEIHFGTLFGGFFVLSRKTTGWKIGVAAEVSGRGRFSYFFRFWALQVAIFGILGVRGGPLWDIRVPNFGAPVEVTRRFSHF